MPPNPGEARRACRALGERLANFRKTAGITQHQLADAIYASRSSIAGIETGRQNADRDFWSRADHLTQANGALLAAYDEARNIQAQLARATATADQAPLPQPRLRPAALDDISSLATNFGFVPGGRLRPRFERLGRNDVARIEMISALYRSLDYEFGGGALCADVSVFAESVSDLLTLSYTEDLKPRLFSAVAAARQLAGWVHFDAGNYADSLRHWIFAERVAIAVADVRLAARIRYSQARQFQHLHNNRDALGSLILAREQLGSAATPAISAMLYGAEAASHAALGDHRTASICLDNAGTHFGRLQPDVEPSWMVFYDHGELLAQHGRVERDRARRDRRHSEKAIELAGQAVRDLAPENLGVWSSTKSGWSAPCYSPGIPTRGLQSG